MNCLPNIVIKLTLNVPPPIPNIEDSVPTDKGRKLPKKPFGILSPILNSSLFINKLIETKKAIKAKIKLTKNRKLTRLLLPQ